MKKFFLKHCKPYRWLICKLFHKPHPDTLNIPWNIYGDFDVCYLGYDKDGNVHKGFKNILDVIQNKGDLGVTVLYES